MKDIETISKTTIRVKMFTHNDLDGVSCALVLKKLYNLKKVSFNFEFIGYNDYDKIENFFNIDNDEGAKIYDYLFISDLNFTGANFSKYIVRPYRKFIAELNDYSTGKSSFFKKIFFIDHHKDSEETLRNNISDYSNILEYYNNMTDCASKQVYDFCVNNKSEEWTNNTSNKFRDKVEDSKCWLEDYLEHVNNWDLFLWKSNNDLHARDLNLLFTHIKRGKFFIMQEQKDSIKFSFNKTETTIINETLQEIEKEYQKALATSIVLDHIDEEGMIHPDIQYIVIRSDENISLICDKIKDAILRNEIYSRFNIRYIVNVSFKYGGLNFRRVYDDINLKTIANIYGGGGHEFAAGALIDGKNELQLNRIIMPTLRKYNEPVNFK